MSNEPQDPFSALAESAAQVHELYLVCGSVPDSLLIKPSILWLPSSPRRCGRVRRPNRRFRMTR
jgi:hypothetical protein